MTGRKPKYKAWDESAKRMGNVLVIDFQSGTVVVSYDNKSDWGVTRVRTGAIIPLDSVVLLEFLGVYDKNGKEIYWGDIVKMQCGCIGAVGYFGHQYDINIENTGSKKERHSRVWHNSFCGMFSWDTDCEVLGNVYENPYLIKREGTQDGKT